MRGEVGMAEEKTFLIKIITPERVFYEGTADHGRIQYHGGTDRCPSAGHIPLTVIVKPGILHITEKDGEKEAALHSGFAEILPEGVIILAEIIEWPNEIDENRAEAALHRAEERLRSKTPETDIARAETALQRAMARIQVLR